jgi:hypothetical protein
MADIDVHQTMVSAALAAKSSADVVKKARWEARSETMGRDLLLLDYATEADRRRPGCAGETPARQPARTPAVR